MLNWWKTWEMLYMNAKIKHLWEQQNETSDLDAGFRLNIESSEQSQVVLLLTSNRTYT